MRVPSARSYLVPWIEEQLYFVLQPHSDWVHQINSLRSLSLRIVPSVHLTGESLVLILGGSLPGNEVAHDLAAAATNYPVDPEDHMVLTLTEIYSRAKEFICRTWVVPVHPWYFKRHPGSAISFKGSRSYQTAFSRFSTGHPRKYRYIYGTGVFETGRFANSLVKLDNVTGQMTVWKETNTMYPSEIVYVPRPGSVEEDDGVLLSVVIDVAEDTRDFLMVLDAKTFKELGRAFVPRSVQLPPTIHGMFHMD
ncbi:beta,beta-carotene 9',10'-oxygenase [Trichonephila clavipes]|nr:beta,beta-carotene 9',10'-oxygenase [Trichonephila clavipes]